MAKAEYKLKYIDRTRGLLLTHERGERNGFDCYIGNSYSGRAIVDIIRRECGDFRVVRDGERILAIETKEQVFTLDNTFSFGGWLLARGLEYDAQRETKKAQYLKEQRKKQVQHDKKS